MTDLLEYAPACGDEDNNEAWANQESLNELEQLTFEAESSLNDLFECSPETALTLMSVFLKNLPERVSENPQMFIMH